MTDWDRMARPSLRGLAAYHPGESATSCASACTGELEPLNRNEDLFGRSPRCSRPPPRRCRTSR